MQHPWSHASLSILRHSAAQMLGLVRDGHAVLPVHHRMPHPQGPAPLPQGAPSSLAFWSSSTASSIQLSRFSTVSLASLAPAPSSFRFFLLGQQGQGHGGGLSRAQAQGGALGRPTEAARAER